MTRRVEEIEALARTYRFGEDDISHLARHLLVALAANRELRERVAELAVRLGDLEAPEYTE